MSFVTRNANLVLFFLLLLCAIALSAATIYFESEFSALNVEYDNKLAELDNVSQTLQVRESALLQVQQELGVKQNREEQISSQFTEVRSEKETLQTAKSRLEEDKVQLQAALKNASAELTIALVSVGEKQSALDQVNADLTTLRDQKVALQSQITQSNTKIDCLKKSADAQEGLC